VTTALYRLYAIWEQTGMKIKILVLGAGFGGLELCTLLSEALGESVEVTLIDKSDHFLFGFSKLDIMFGHAEARAVRLPYASFAKSGVQFIQQTITKIDPVAKRVTADTAGHSADYLVVALGADYDCIGLRRRLVWHWQAYYRLCARHLCISAVPACVQRNALAQSPESGR